MPDYAVENAEFECVSKFDDGDYYGLDFTWDLKTYSIDRIRAGWAVEHLAARVDHKYDSGRICRQKGDSLPIFTELPGSPVSIKEIPFQSAPKIQLYIRRTCPIL